METGVINSSTAFVRQSNRAPTVEEILGNVRNMVHFFEKEGLSVGKILKKPEVREREAIGQKLKVKNDVALKSASLVKSLQSESGVTPTQMATGNPSNLCARPNREEQPLYVNIEEVKLSPPPQLVNKPDDDEPLYMNVGETLPPSSAEQFGELYDVPRCLNIYDSPKDLCIPPPIPTIPPPDYSDEDCQPTRSDFEDLGLEVIPEEPEQEAEEERALSTSSSLDGSSGATSTTSGVHSQQSQSSPSPSSRKDEIVMQKEKDRMIEVYHETVRQRQHASKNERKLDVFEKVSAKLPEKQAETAMPSRQPGIVSTWDPTLLLFHLYRVPEPRRRPASSGKSTEEISSVERKNRPKGILKTDDHKHSYVQPSTLPRDPQLFLNILIVDLGACSSRAGILSGDPTLPQLFFPTAIASGIVGHQALLPTKRKDVIFPLRATTALRDRLDILSIKCIFQHICSCLRVQPCKYQLMLSLPHSISAKSQKELLELLFDSLKFQAVNMAHQSILSLCLYNTTTGIVVDVGERVDIVPISDGYILDAGVSRIPNFGGANVQNHLQKAIVHKHSSYSTQVEHLVLRYLQEEACYCSQEYKQDLKRFKEDPQEYQQTLDMSKYFREPGLEAWRTVRLGLPRIQAPEGLFNPQVWGVDNIGVSRLVHRALQESGVDVRRELARNIYLSGGVTLLKGFARRLASEVDRLTPPALKIKVHGSPYRYHSAFLGACVLANSSAYAHSKMDRDDWVKGQTTVKWRV